MKISIDYDLCTGHGRCYDLAPDVFDADDAGYGQVIPDGDVPTQLEGKARLAAQNCPERAISVVD